MFSVIVSLSLLVLVPSIRPVPRYRVKSGAPCPKLGRWHSRLGRTVSGGLVEKRLGSPGILGRSNSEVSLPPAERGRVDADGPSEPLLRQPSSEPTGLQMDTERQARRRSNQAADPAQEAQGRSSSGSWASSPFSLWGPSTVPRRSGVGLLISI